MSWRPHISVWTSKNGSPISPTTSLGFGLAGILFIAMISGGVLLLVTRELIGIVPLILGAAFFKDVWAWFAAGPDERTEFLNRVSAANEKVRLVLGTPPIPVGPVMATGASLVFMGACVAMGTLGGQPQVLAMIASLYFAGFSCLCWRDVLRARKTPK